MLQSELSKKFIEVIPVTMGSIRRELRTLAHSEFTTLQFRILTRLARGEASNGELAHEIGTSVPGMSRIVDALVRRGYVVRVQGKGDRRKVGLRLSAIGRKKYENVRTAAQERFSEYFGGLDPSKLQAVSEGLSIIEELFAKSGRSS